MDNRAGTASAWPALVALLGFTSFSIAAGAPSDVDQGRRIFAKHCQQCHPGGSAGIGPSLKLKPASSFRIKTQIRMGKGKMPPFTPSQINRDDLQRLVAYLQTLPAAPPAHPRVAVKRK